MQHGLCQLQHNCYVGSILTVLRTLKWWKKLCDQHFELEPLADLYGLWSANCAYIHAVHPAQVCSPILPSSSINERHYCKISMYSVLYFSVTFLIFVIFLCILLPCM